MSDGQRPTMHGRDHRPGGADPIPGIVVLTVDNIWVPVAQMFPAVTAGCGVAAVYESPTTKNNFQYFAYPDDHVTHGWGTSIYKTAFNPDTSTVVPHVVWMADASAGGVVVWEVDFDFPLIDGTDTDDAITNDEAIGTNLGDFIINDSPAGPLTAFVDNQVFALDVWRNTDHGDDTLVGDALLLGVRFSFQAVA